MKTAGSLFFLLYAFSMICAQEAQYLKNIYHYLENTQVYELNQEEGHVPLTPYESVTEALTFNRIKSAFYKSLNGTWKFHYSDTPEGTPEGFYRKISTTRAGIPFMCHQTGKCRDILTHFSEMLQRLLHPIPLHVPREYNPTGSYRRSFTIPEAWKGREIFLRLEKTASASFIWVNGKEVGYNEGGQEPAEYNITRFVKPGKNILAVNVYKYSDGYYLEDQDYWRLAGIFDDVWLFAAPKMHIFDWFAITDLDEFLYQCPS